MMVDSAATGETLNARARRTDDRAHHRREHEPGRTGRPAQHPAVVDPAANRRAFAGRGVPGQRGRLYQWGVQGQHRARRPHAPRAAPLPALLIPARRPRAVATGPGYPGRVSRVTTYLEPGGP